MPRDWSTLSLLTHSARAFVSGRRGAPAWRSAERSPEPEAALVISQVLWHDVWGRAQEVAQRLAERVPTRFLSPTPVNRMLEARDPHPLEPEVRLPDIPPEGGL